MKQRLLKRILPMILSVSMVVGSVPGTTFAAESKDSADAEETVYEEENTNKSLETGVTQETETSDTGTAVTASENETEVYTETAVTETEGITVTEEITERTEQTATDEKENTAAALDTKIIVNKKSLGEVCKNQYQYDVDNEVVLVKYDMENENPFAGILSDIKDAGRDIISVEVDDKTSSALKDKLTYQWQKADGANLEESAVPTEAGSYMLVISLDAVEDTCSAAVAKIAFQIVKRQLAVTLDDEFVTPGTTVSAFKTNAKCCFKLENVNWNGENATDITEDKDTYIASLALAVYDPYNMDTELTDEVKFLEGSDYVVSVKTVLKDTAATNYRISEESILRVKVHDRMETVVNAAQKNPTAVISKVYTKDAEKQIVYETDIKDLLELSVIAYNENAEEEKDREITLENATVQEVWFDAAKLELGEGAAFEPETAGTYYLGFRYYPKEEDANIYKAYTDADNLITIVIEKAPLTLVPALKGNAPERFYTGMTEADVVKYADYTLFNADNEEVQIDRDTFWGVSYDDIQGGNIYDNTTSTRQSYEPVFQLIRAEKDADGNPKKDETGKEIWTENGSEDRIDAANYLYRLVFTGKKAVYTTEGALSGKLLPVNGSDVDAEDRNHAIVTTADVLSAKYADVPVAEPQKTKMDISGILQENFNTANLNDLYKPAKLVSKVYDGKALYEPSRGEYKKAVVTTLEDGQEAAKNYDSAMKYTWYQINGVKAVYDEADPENPKQTGWEVSKKTQVGNANNHIPTAAGEYMLEITFSKTGYETCTERIYYRIDKQLLVVDIGEIPTAFRNESVLSYTSAVHYEEQYNVYMVPENQYSEAVKTEDNLLKDWYNIPFDKTLKDYASSQCYKLNWYVEQVRLDDNNQPVTDENGNVVYDRLNDNDTISVVGADTYRLGVELTSKNGSYTNYEIVYDAEINPTPIFTSKYYNSSKNISVAEAEAGTTKIAIELNAEKLTTTKDYDGKPFYASVDEAWTALRTALTIKNVETGEEIAQADWPQLVYDIEDITDPEDTVSVDFAEMVYGGSYMLSLYVLPDAVYQFAYLESAAEYTINRIALKITPVLAEDIPAGTNVRNMSDGIIYNLSKTEFAGYIEDDKDAFEYGTPVYVNGTKTLGFGAYAYVEDKEDRYNTLSATVSKAGDAGRYSGYIKYGKEYAVQFAGELAYPYSRNYDVEYVRKTFQATRRGNATVDSNAFPKDNLNYCFVKTDLAQRNEGTTVTITPVQPIPYIKTPTLPHTDAFGNVIQKEGNYFEFEIQAPKEFFEDTTDCGKYRDGFLYRSSIEAAGGYVLETFEGLTDDNKSNMNECIVVFPVEEKAVKKFEIIWEKGYTEQFVIDFTNAVLEEDLAKAVAPKSLSFNGVNTKMAVGEEQQLDVKIKKVQISDIIYIDYQVAQGSDVISVTSDDSKGVSGYVTALKPGKATVVAVPVKLVNGVKTKIEGAKEAKVSITVSDVTAPAIKKVTATDKKVTFTYLKPTNGYRREVYILAGKKKAEDFETLIRSMNNGQWRGIFTVQPQYYANESADAKKITNEMNISGLPANGEYTLYVRNVSGIRTLEDGSCVQLSAKGTVKSFKTTKPQAEALRLYAKDDTDRFVTTKNVKLTDKTEQLYTQGRFSAIDIDPAADSADKSWLTLPLDKAYSKAFAAPKLVYGVTSDLNAVDVSDIRDFRNYTYISGRYYKKTDIATVDKSGKVTFKGVGKVYVIVYDQIEKQKKAQVTLNIYANADSVQAKDTKLAVGKRVYLSSLLTYYEGKTMISGMDYQNTGIIGTSYKPNLTMSAETVSKINSEGNFAVTYTGDGDYSITALKPNVVCEITAKDGTLPVSLKIQSTPIEPVKELKVADMVDNGFLISISFSVDTAPETWHRIDIIDERGNVVESDKWGSRAFNTSYDGKKKVYTQVFEDDVHKQDEQRYTSKKITRLSKYKVSVTTVIGDEASAKPVTKSVKTTDFPASHWDLVANEYGGIKVTAYSWAGTEKNNFSLSTRKYLTSGNAYTLTAAVDASAQYRMTDTLTWRSTNPKVAGVKAKAGTYTAQLNALMPGSTVVEVTSKITRKVIARWPVFVKAVGNAKDCYYGDYEYTGEYVYSYDPNYTGTVEVLTLQNAVRVTSSEVYDEYTNSSISGSNYKWVKFTAPAYGKYQFNCTGTLDKILSPLGKTVSVQSIANRNYIAMLEGETLYFKVGGIFTMEISDYVKQGTSFTVEDGSVLVDSDLKQYIEFRSTGDNVYTFYSKELPAWAADMKLYDTNSSPYDNKRQKRWTDDEGVKNCDVSIDAGDNIYLEVPAGKYTIYVKNRTAVLLEEMTKFELTDKVNEQWYTYTAAVDGLYTFKSKDATSALTVAYYKSLKDLNATSWNVASEGNDFSGKMTLKAGEQVVFNISAVEAAAATIIVTPEIPVNLAIGEEKALPVNADSRRWVAFQLPEAGRYRFSAVSTEEDAAYEVNLRYFKNAIEENEITTIEKNEIIVSDKEWDSLKDQPDIAKGDTVYVEITTKKEGTDAADVKVRLTQVTATELTLDNEVPVMIKDGEELWFTFTPPEKGNYIVQSKVTPNAQADGTETKTHTLLAAWYAYGLEQRNSTDKFQAVGAYDVYGEYTVNVKTRTFMVSADELGVGEDGTGITTTAAIVVKELTPTPLALNQPEEVSLMKNERKWYSFTASETNTYLFKRDKLEGRVSSQWSDGIRTAGQGGDMSSAFYPFDMEKNQTIYIEDHENLGGPAKFMRTIDYVHQMSGAADETVEVTGSEPRYFRYTADVDNYYMISYTIQPADADVTVSYGENIKETTVDLPAGRNYLQRKMRAKESFYVKASTESETPVTVTLYAVPVEPLQLAVGTAAELTAETGGTDRYTWCSFTAETAGRYRVDMSSAEPDKTLDAIHMKCYSSMMDETETLQSDHYYKVGETGYFAVYNEGTQAQKVNITVADITPTPIEDTTDKGASVEETLAVGVTKEYFYKIPKTGIYEFANLSSDVSTAIYMDITDNNDGVPFVKDTKQMFLRENDEIYISTFSSEGGTAKFSIMQTDEPQALSEENKPTAIEYNGKDAKLIAFTATETALYNFEIVYSAGRDAGYDDYVYYMNHSQILWENSALFSKEHGQNVGEDAGIHKVYARMLLEGEMGYLYIPSIQADATIKASRFDEEPVVKTLKINEPTTHAFRMEEKEEVDEDGNITKTQVGERIWYVFDAPEDGDYTLTFDKEGAGASYKVQCFQNGLHQLSFGGEHIQIKDNESFDISGIKKKQRVCLVITKEKGKLEAQKLTITVTKKQ